MLQFQSAWRYVNSLNTARGRSQTMFTRGGGEVVKKNQLFVNFYTIENVNGGG